MSLVAAHQTIAEHARLAFQCDGVISALDFSPIGDAAVFGDGFDVGWLGELPGELAEVEADGQLRLPVNGACGQRVRLQRSEDLVDWEEWQTMTLGGEGCGLIDNTTGKPHRFYRIVEDGTTVPTE